MRVWRETNPESDKMAA